LIFFYSMKIFVFLEFNLSTKSNWWSTITTRCSLYSLRKSNIQYSIAKTLLYSSLYHLMHFYQIQWIVLWQNLFDQLPIKFDVRFFVFVYVIDNYLIYFVHSVNSLVDTRWSSFDNRCIEWRIYIMEWINI
jgi:hypothetical protein